MHTVSVCSVHRCGMPRRSVVQQSDIYWREGDSLLGQSHPQYKPTPNTEREFLIDNLLVRIHVIIVMVRWTGLAPWEFEFPFPGSLTYTFLASQTRAGSSGSSKASTSRPPSQVPSSPNSRLPHEAIHANRFISQSLDYADKHAKSVCQQPAQRVLT